TAKERKPVFRGTQPCCGWSWKPDPFLVHKKIRCILPASAPRPSSEGPIERESSMLTSVGAVSVQIGSLPGVMLGKEGRLLHVQ
ncbi:hypothetical protein JOQ06_015884, partial [Pogonophryne albipinna]